MINQKIQNQVNELNRLVDNDQLNDEETLHNKSCYQSNDGILFNSEPIQDNKHSNGINDFLITTLKDEIIFLRNEISSKDKIIELILTQIPKFSEPDKSARKLKVDNESGFMAYNKIFEPSNKSSLKNVVPINNKYTPLDHNTSHVKDPDAKMNDDVIIISENSSETRGKQ